MGPLRAIAFLYVAGGLALAFTRSPQLAEIHLALIRMAFLLVILEHAGSGAICGLLGSFGSLLVVTGDAQLGLAGTILCLAAVLPAIARRPGLSVSAALLVVAFGLGLDAFDPALDGVQLRMMRLAQVAAIALPLLALEYPEGDGRWNRIGRGLSILGMVGLPVVLAAAATVSIELKYLLPIPADAMTIAMVLAVFGSQRSLQKAGFAIVAASMIAGLLMGAYAFDGPLPSPVGAYDEPLRRLLRQGHVVVMVAGAAAIAFTRADPVVPIRLDGPDLARLNASSLTKSFVPQTDIDWTQATTADEYERLYHVWSLFVGSGKDQGLSREDRIQFVKYQQITLMRFTALLERHGVSGIARLYDVPATLALTEYVGHFIKEEIYHYTMFTQAIERILATMPGKDPPPVRAFDRALRLVFGAVDLVPSPRIRLVMTFTMFRFAEQVTIYAHDMFRKTVPRKESLVGQVWAHHALDEARHLKFDDMVIEELRPRGALGRLPELLILPACILMSVLLNANEVWAARQLGVRVHLWHLPGLMRRTEAPFKRRVFDLVRRLSAGARPEEASA
jgi:hypothetical protein